MRERPALGELISTGCATPELQGTPVIEPGLRVLEEPLTVVNETSGVFVGSHCAGDC